MKFECESLPELVFEKTRVYYVNFQFYYLSVILSIKCYLKSFLLSCFHILVMFLIIPDNFWNFQKSSFSGPPASHFSQRSHLRRQVSLSDWSGFIFKSSHKFVLLGGKSFQETVIILFFKFIKRSIVSQIPVIGLFIHHRHR